MLGFSSELQIGIAYALRAGALWGIGPLLLKRVLRYTDVSTATLVEQHVSVILLVGLAIDYGEIGQIDFAGGRSGHSSSPAASAPASEKFFITKASTRSALRKPLR